MTIQWPWFLPYLVIMWRTCDLRWYRNVIPSSRDSLHSNAIATLMVDDFTQAQMGSYTHMYTHKVSCGIGTPYYLILYVDSLHSNAHSNLMFARALSTFGNCMAWSRGTHRDNVKLQVYTGYHSRSLGFLTFTDPPPPPPPPAPGGPSCY